MFSKGPRMGKLDIDPNIDPALAKSLVNKEFAVFIMKFIISAVALLFGCYFIWLGIESDSIIRFSFGELELELNKALPGITLAFISLILMLFSRINVKDKK